MDSWTDLCGSMWIYVVLCGFDTSRTKFDFQQETIQSIGHHVRDNVRSHCAAFLHTEVVMSSDEALVNLVEACDYFTAPCVST